MWEPLIYMRHLFMKPVFLLNNFFSSKSNVLIALLFFIITAFFSSLIPPFQSPDEPDHLKRAYLLAQGRIAMVSPENSSTGGYIDQSLFNYMLVHSRLTGKEHEKVNKAMVNEARQLHWSGNETFVIAPGVNYYFPLVYLPQSIGLKLGQLLDLSIHHSYHLARFMASLSILVMLWYAFSLASPSLLTLGLLCMPPVLFQGISTSQDGVAIALLVLCGSIFIRLMRGMSSSDRNQYIVFMVGLVILLTSRINLIPMLLMPLILAWRYRCRWLWAGFAAATIVVLLWVLYALLSTVDNRVALGASTSTLFFYYLSYPFSFLNIVWASIHDSSLQHFYGFSFVGIMGWLEITIGDQNIKWIGATLAALLLISVSIKRLTQEWQQRATLALVAISSALMVFLLMLVTWTPHPAEVIEGVQGRYLWSSALLLSFALTQGINQLTQPVKIVGISLLLVIVSITLVKLPNVLLERYYIDSNVAEIYRAQSNEKNGFSFQGSILEARHSDFPGSHEGHIDNLTIKDNEVTLVGWGFFSSGSKQFFSNLPDSIPVMYKNILRPDVAAAFNNEAYISSGFELKIRFDSTADLVNIMKDFCLYTEDPEFGSHRIHSSGNSGYQCGVEHHE
ncbi:DUF2142 domain-containing protein [Cellvibrio polysaccharolyticus]|uniref:DUF2142 domain-containing protein n=1 Tax=Cellvibrio polysaccharolyticus TaxID=2082724 RepID=A0A928YUV2_9GAMM|nr:DUF2142 domain-containing protein [Cellvibrio polysaccharolyticus]MBE8718362.1 DUF2142 domain-containing protein [Cellvibrio polysaccharolyticus]